MVPLRLSCQVFALFHCFRPWLAFLLLLALLVGCRPERLTFDFQPVKSTRFNLKGWPQQVDIPEVLASASTLGFPQSGSKSPLKRTALTATRRLKGRMPLVSPSNDALPAARHRQLSQAIGANAAALRPYARPLRPLSGYLLNKAGPASSPGEIIFTIGVLMIFAAMILGIISLFGVAGIGTVALWLLLGGVVLGGIAYGGIK